MSLKEYIIYSLSILKKIIIPIPYIKDIIVKIENDRNRTLKSMDSADFFKETIQRAYRIYDKIMKRIKDQDKNYSLKNKIILEFGPGSNLLLPIIFLLNGAKKVYLIDKYKRIYDNYFNLQLFNQFLNSINKDRENIDFDKLKKKIVYFPDNPFESFNKLKKNSIDILFSYAVLQYIYKLENAITRINLLLKNNGYTYHQVDLRDLTHIKDSAYLNFLKFSPWVWKIIGNTNQYRYNYYINLFKKYNFEIINSVYMKTKEYNKIDIIKNSFHKRYRNLSNEELSIIGFNILAKKKKSF